MGKKGEEEEEEEIGGMGKKRGKRVARHKSHDGVLS